MGYKRDVSDRVLRRLPRGVVAWPMLNRDGLTVLLRPETGHDLRDHGVHAVWFGAVLPLHLAAFRQQGKTV